MADIEVNGNPLYVDAKDPNAYKSIQDAIDAASPGCNIQVITGYYPSFVINKPGIKIQPASKSDNVIILADSKQTVTIDFEGDTPAEIHGLKFGHTAVESKINFQKMIKIFLSKKKTHMQSTENITTNFAEFYHSDLNHVALLRVSKGHLICTNCLFSYKLLAKSLEYLISAVILEEDTKTVMRNCEIAGNKHYLSCGMLIHKANAEIENCKIHNHGFGGFSVFLKKSNRFECKNSIIFRNKIGGIDLNNQEGSLLLTGNKIINNVGYGIKCGLKTVGTISKNQLINNTIGIYLVSSECHILKNVVKKSIQSGIVSTIKDEMGNKSEIKMNTITENKENGILIEGANNVTLVQSNYKISHNNERGVLIRNHAFPEITSNSIYGNMKQGVLIQEDAAAKIIKNSIYKNIKANIALGGEFNDKSVIIYNKIYSSAAEGIFAMKTGPLVIHNNDVFENYDGIVLSESHADVKANTIHDNFVNGLFFIDGSNPTITNNIIEKNEGIGLLIKDTSAPTLEGNRITDNEINVASENKKIGMNVWTDNNNNGQQNDIFAKTGFCNIF